MRRIMLALVTLLVIFNAGTALAGNPPGVLFYDFENSPVSSDDVWLGCAQTDGGDPAIDCVAQLWYYFSTEPCSGNKADYIYSVPTTVDNFGGRWAEITIDCTDIVGPYPYDHLCLWVEDGEGETKYGKSPQLYIDCGGVDAEIISPKQIAPVVRGRNDSLDVEIEIYTSNVKVYRLRIRNEFGTELCDIVTWPEGDSGTFTETCSWSGAPDGSYNVWLRTRDWDWEPTIIEEIGAVIISDDDPPSCLGTRTVYILGTLETGRPDAFNLNDQCDDPEGGDLTFAITDASDCIGLVDGVTMDAAENIDIGKSLKNLEIEGWSESCMVDYTASDGTTTVNSSFEIEVFKTGDIKIYVRYPAGEGETLYDIIYELPITELHGKQCFDIVVENNKSPFIIDKPLDMAFVLDASGSMSTEISGVKGVIDGVADYVSNMCVDESGPIPGCFQIGLVTMDGDYSAPATGRWYDLTPDSDYIKSVVAAFRAIGGYEAWADFIINIIYASAEFEPVNMTVNRMSWRPEAKHLIIVISDASNDGQPYERYKANMVAAYALDETIIPGGVIISFLGKRSGCDPAGCPMQCSVADCSGPNDPTGEMRNVADATDGLAIPYFESRSEAENQQEIIDAIESIVREAITEDDIIVVANGDPGEAEVPPDPWVECDECGDIVSVERGSTYIIDTVCITAKKLEDAEITFEVEGVDGDTLDSVVVVVETPDVIADPVAFVSGPGRTSEGEEETFDGRSSASDSADPIVSWAWEVDGNPVPAVVGPVLDYTFEDNKPGNAPYNVTLTITTQSGRRVSFTHAIEVVNRPPSGIIDSPVGLLPDELKEGEEVSLIALFTDPGNDILTYSWDFGDGSPFESTQTVSHDWDSDGWYNVTVTVTDDDGGVGIATVGFRILRLPGDIFSISGDIVIMVPDGLGGWKEVQAVSPTGTINIEVDIKNDRVDPRFGTPLSTPGTLIVEILDPEDMSVLASASVTQTFNSGETSFKADGSDDDFEFDLSTLALEGKEFVIIQVRIEAAPGIGEPYVANNTKQIIVSLAEVRPTPVPEMHLFLVAVVSLAVLFLIRKRS